MGSNFLQQFMAGWQMGQGRNESQRRNQELEMERQRQQQMMAQRAQEFELEKERYAAEKKRLAAEEAQFNWNAKKEAAALQSRNQQTLPPETQDLGGGTTLNLGAAVQPRAPIMAAIPGAPEGTPEVPMLFREDIQDIALSDLQRKNLEALGMRKKELEVEEPFKISDDRRAAELAAQRDASVERRYYARQEASEKKAKGNATKLRTEYNTQLKPYLQEIDQFNKAKSLASVPDEARTPADDIALVFLFMKAQDPGSTVREGEYATAKNAAGVPERVRNAYNEAIKGTFLTPEQRAAFASSIERNFNAGPGARIASIQKRYDFLAKDAGIDPSLVLMESGILGEQDGSATSGGDYEPTAVPGVRRRKIQR